MQKMKMWLLTTLQGAHSICYQRCDVKTPGDDYQIIPSRFGLLSALVTPLMFLAASAMAHGGTFNVCHCFGRCNEELIP